MSSESSLQLSEQLIALRAEVDQLQTQLDTDRQEHKATMASLATQAGDLENQANRQKVLLSQLKDKLKKTQTLSAQTITDSETLEPLLQDVISQIVQSIKSGLPFKKEQRIAAIKEISQQIAEKKLDTYRATSRISSIIEDELRLTHDNGIYSQTIPLNGDNLLVDVAKIGMYTLYFRTKDQQYGMAINNAGNWQFALVENTQSKQEIMTLFTSLEKQIRQGFFTLPFKVENS